MANYIYESITEDTVRTARATVLEDLEKLTDGHAQEALNLAAAYAELDGVLKAHEERQGITA